MNTDSIFYMRILYANHERKFIRNLDVRHICERVTFATIFQIFVILSALAQKLWSKTNYCILFQDQKSEI